MIDKVWCITLLVVWISSSLSSKPTFTLDEFFDYTEFVSLTLAPDDGQSILIQTKHCIWNQSVNEQHLHLQTLRGENRTLITTHASYFKPQWKGDLIALILESSSTSRKKQKKKSIAESQYIHLYSVRTNQMFPILIGNEPIHAYTWSTTSMSLYFATRSPWSEEVEEAYENEWKDTIQYREQHRGDSIYRVDIENMTVSKIELLMNISLSVDELTCSPDGKQLVFLTESKSLDVEQIADFELYSFDLTNHSPLIPLKLTNNSAVERNLKWSTDGSLFFTVHGEGAIESEYEDSQGRLYSLNTTSGEIQRWANQFQGDVNGYDLLQGGRGGVVILGQLSTEVQVYIQQSMNAQLIKQTGWPGSYQNIVTSSGNNSSIIVFIHSSYEAPQEVYFIDNIDQLIRAQAITSENKLFLERSLPKGKSYRWINEDDKIEIEGVLLYPPEKFEQKNLSLLVLIHGGPYGADLNIFQADWYSCAGMMATEGWLVLQPNYRGSTGYGDEFLRGVRFEILSRPGKDILYGVDALVRDGIADPKRLAVGGYSYGGYLTNWLITQTTRFNAALSGAGAIEHVADWGTTDIPLTSVYFFGGFPWQVSYLYQQEAAIFQMDKVRTPTHIVVGDEDIRVSPIGSYILERALSSLGIPTKLIIFPGEPHIIENNPWHEKIKVREELKWLHKYGNTCICAYNNTLSSATYSERMQIYTFIFVVLVFLAHFENY